MAIILPKQGSASENLGTALGSGLGNILQSLGEGYQQRQLAQGFKQQGLPGILSQLDPQVQAAYLRQFGAAQQMAQKQQNENLIGNLINESLGLQSAEMGQMGMDQVQPLINRMQEGFSGASVSQQQPQAQQQSIPSMRLSPGARAAQERQRFENAVARGGYSPDQIAKAQERLDEREGKLQAQQDKIDKANKEYFTQIAEQAQGAEEADTRLERMQQLILQGNLPYPGTAGLADLLEKGIFGFGLNIKGALYHPDAQEFEKLSQDFLKNAKKIFGSRVTEGEVRMFLKTVPSLAQSDAGKERLISNMQLMNKASQLKYDAAQDIIAENEGYQPANLRNLVEKRIKPQLEALHKQFSQGVRDSRKFISAS